MLEPNAVVFSVRSRLRGWVNTSAYGFAVRQLKRMFWSCRVEERECVDVQCYCCWTQLSAAQV